MKEFCIVISKIQRKEIRITAESEAQAVEKVKQLYAAGKIQPDSVVKETVNFHPRY